MHKLLKRGLWSGVINHDYPTHRTQRAHYPYIHRISRDGPFVAVLVIPIISGSNSQVWVMYVVRWVDTQHSPWQPNLPATTKLNPRSCL